MRIMTKPVCRIVWLVAFAGVVAIFIHSGWKIGVPAALLLIAATDLAIFFIASLTELPCGFTEWVCYPGYGIILPKGCHMRWGVICRIAEVASLIVFSGWLAKVVKSLF